MTRFGVAAEGGLCIESSMRGLRKGWWILSLIIGLAVVASAGTPGSFRGTIVDGPHDAGKNWIYVQGRNGMARRVDISRARVSYDESVPTATRLAKPEDALTPGAEVRVTAEQGSDGEWRASQVEILKKQLAASN
ncbi:MAG: hypothetical protein WBW69_09730 [Candidatus Korobacteraceae bacterium]